MRKVANANPDDPALVRKATSRLRESIKRDPLRSWRQLKSDGREALISNNWTTGTVNYRDVTGVNVDGLFTANILTAAKDAAEKQALLRTAHRR